MFRKSFCERHTIATYYPLCQLVYNGISKALPKKAGDWINLYEMSFSHDLGKMGIED